MLGSGADLRAGQAFLPLQGQVLALPLEKQRPPPALLAQPELGPVLRGLTEEPSHLEHSASHVSSRSWLQTLQFSLLFVTMTPAEGFLAPVKEGNPEGYQVSVGTQEGEGGSIF